MPTPIPVQVGLSRGAKVLGYLRIAEPFLHGINAMKIRSALVKGSDLCC
jgi:hypothetical protein